MSQTEFHYKIMHKGELQLDELEDKDFVDEVDKSVTIETNQGMRSIIVVKVAESTDFERLDDMLESRYDQVWFDF